MKRMMILALAIFFQSTLHANEGIRFETMKWAQIKAKALKEKKMIFLDAFASWCGPCKYMEENIYSDKKAADYFNEQYINVKIDMEEGEGPALSEEFNISAYPTFLFFTPEGKLVHKSVGAMDIDEFIELGKKAKLPDQQYFTLKTKASASTLNDAQFLTWAEQADKLEDDEREDIIKKYIASKKDIFASKDILSVAFYHSKKTDQLVSQFLKNRSRMISIMNWDTATANVELYNLVFSHSLKAYTRNDSSVDSFLALFKKLYPAKSDIAEADINYRIELFVNKDASAATDLLIGYMKEVKRPIGLETIANWLINNVDEFSKADFEKLSLAMESFSPRSFDKGNECWLYLMQMMAAGKGGNAEKAKEFANKAYNHPNLPAVYKEALRSNYEIK